jgi:hypothetical protein
MQAETYNSSTKAKKKQFSLNPLVNNSLINQNSSNNTSYLSNLSSSNINGHITYFSSYDPDKHSNSVDPPTNQLNFEMEDLI